jgi:hypothetical protein
MGRSIPRAGGAVFWDAYATLGPIVFTNAY